MVMATSHNLDILQTFLMVADHFIAHEMGSKDIHGTQLVKEVTYQYARIRLLTYAQKHTREMVQTNRASVRHNNLKMTLFSHM